MGYERTVLKAATGVVVVGALVAAGARFLGPPAAALVSDGLPRAREAAAAWMTPPYLYLVINAIIISIAASSRFQFQPSSSSDRPSASAELEPEQQVADVAPLHVPAPVPVVPLQAAELMAVEEPVVVKKKPAPAPAPAMEKEIEDEEFSISRSSWTPRRRGAEPVVVVDEDVDDEAAPFADLTNSREKPLVSARFSRKASKPSPEGSKALRVARPRKEETLEGTWKAITEGRAPPLARHLKKSDTCPGRRPSGGSGEVDPAAPAGAMRKAETFNDGRSGKAPVVRREPSLGQDELNRRVEAFIHKFNMEMRLQRQESLNHYNEMLRLTHY